MPELFLMPLPFRKDSNSHCSCKEQVAGASFGIYHMLPQASQIDFRAMDLNFSVFLIIA
jgi:hypothetical protein